MDSSNIEDLRSAIGERYEIEGFLAEGGMGTVFAAKNRSLGSRVAIKVLPPEIAFSAVRLARFKREAALAANLSHPHIVPVFEFDASGGIAYLVMPLVDGITLAELIERRGRLEWNTVREIVKQVAAALGFAHSKNVVHRDIKPANILLEEATGRWLLTDFGVAHVTDPSDTDITQSGVAIGTPAYMSPEQQAGGTVDGRSDLYSLAAVAYQALCGTPTDKLSAELVRGSDQVHKAIRQAVPGLDPNRARALVWPLAARREDRPGTADEWTKAIDVENKAPTMIRRFVIAAISLLAVTMGWIALRPTADSAAQRLPSIAVLPFQVEVLGDTNDLARTIPQALDWQLQYLPDHRVVGAVVRREISSRYADILPQPDTLFAIARRHGATFTVQGRVAATERELSISVLVHEAATGRLLANADASGPADSLNAMVSELVVETFAERIARELTGWASSLPQGLDAINAYVQGDRNFRRGDYESAVEHFDVVVRLDTSFAPAHLKRMLSLMLGLRPTQYTSQLWTALDAARKYREKLDPVSRQLLDGYELLLREGDVQGAERALLNIVQRYPRAVEAWFLLGYVQFNLRAVLNTSLAESRRAFRRAVQRDSLFASALWHLALISVLENEHDAARQYLDRFLAVDSTSLQARIAETYDSLLYRGTRATARVLGSLEDRSTGVLEVMSLGAGEMTPPPGVRPVARAALDAFWNSASSRFERSMAFRMRIAYLLGRGQLASADSLFRFAEQAQVAQDEVDRWIVLTSITGVAGLADLFAEHVQAAAVLRLQRADRDRAEAIWLTARWHLMNDQEVALPLMEQLSALAADTITSTPLARSLEADLEAQQLIQRGDTAGAIAVWDSATDNYSVDRLIFGLTASLWHIHLERAEVALSSGDVETAIRVTRKFDRMAGFVDQLVWPEILRIRAAAAAEAGRMRLERETYERLANMLANANGTGAAIREWALSELAILEGS